MSSKNVEPTVFLSYNHRDFAIADEIDEVLSSVGVLVKRDIRDVQFGMSFKEFMNGVQTSDFIIMIISDEFLKSSACMYEVVEMLNSHRFQDNFLPVLTRNSKKVFVDDQRTDYYKFWDQQLEEAESRLKQFTNQDFLSKKKQIVEITNKIDVFFNKLLDVRGSHFDDLKKDKFAPLFDRLKISDRLLTEEEALIFLIPDDEEREIALDKMLSKRGINKYVLLNQAVALGIRGKQLKRAKYYYEKLVDNYPDFAIGFRCYALFAAMYLEHHGLARDLFEKALRLDSSDITTNVQFATLLHHHFKDFPRAKEHYELGLKADLSSEDTHLNSNFVGAYMDFARLLDLQYEEYDSAIKFYLKSISLEYEVGMCHYFIAKIYHEKAFDIDKTEKHYKIALTQEPENWGINNDYGHFLMLFKSDTKNAEKYLLKAVEIDPNSALSLKNLGTLYFVFMKEHQLAITQYEKANSIEPDYKTCFNLSVLWHEQIKDLDKSLMYINQALALNPIHAKSHVYKAILLLNSKSDMTEAKEHYLRAVSLDGTLARQDLERVFEITR